MVIRLTDDPAPRLLYCFSTEDDGKTINAKSLIQRIQSGDIDSKELLVGVSDLESQLAHDLKAAGIKAITGVKAASAAAVKAIHSKLGIKG